MKKRLFSLLLILSLALSLCAAVHAEEARFVFDENDLIDAESEEILEQYGARIFDETGVAVCVCIAENAAVGDDIGSFAKNYYNEHVGAENGILLVQIIEGDSSRLTCFKVGDKLASLGSEDVDEILNAYNTSDSYFSSVHSYMSLVSARLGGTKAFGEVTPEDDPNIPAERQPDRVVDRAGVLDASSLAKLNAMADKVSEKYHCDVAVVFLSSIHGEDIVTYSDNYFLNNGYGMGAGRDGILLLITVSDREFNESTSGYATYAFTPYGLTNYLEPHFTRYLSRGNEDWAGAAEQFINDCGTLLEQARNGQPYDVPQPAQKSLKETAPLAALISAVIGFFSGGIPAGAMKRKMKSVAREYGAANYARGGLNLRARDDRFLYANVARTPIPQHTEHRGSGGGGGGSTLHVTSGHTFGGSHGKF